MSKLDEIVPNLTELQRINLRTLMYDLMLDASKENEFSDAIKVYVEKVKTL